MSRPWLSVIMPTCDGGRYLRHALASVARQGDEAIEVVLVDDGSRDDTLAIARGFQTRLALTVRAMPHAGNWVARANEGMRAARGEYLCILHQDDAWADTRVARLKRLAARYTRAAIFVHPCWFLDAAGRRVGYWRCPFPRAATVLRSPQVLERLLVQCLYGMPAPLFTKVLARRVGWMDESLWFSADWDFWLKLTRLGDTVYSPTPLAMFRLHADSQTITRGLAGDEIHRQQTLVRRRHLDALPSAALAAEVERVGCFSTDVNAALARLLAGQPTDAAALSARLMSLGPSGWLRYFRDSRVVERCLSRVRAGAIHWRGGARARRESVQDRQRFALAALGADGARRNALADARRGAAQAS